MFLFCCVEPRDSRDLDNKTAKSCCVICWTQYGTRRLKYLIDYLCFFSMFDLFSYNLISALLRVAVQENDAWRKSVNEG